jgi:hypothetical protein
VWRVAPRESVFTAKMGGRTRSHVVRRSAICYPFPRIHAHRHTHTLYFSLSFNSVYICVCAMENMYSVSSNTGEINATAERCDEFTLLCVKRDRSYILGEGAPRTTFSSACSYATRDRTGWTHTHTYIHTHTNMSTETVYVRMCVCVR